MDIEMSDIDDILNGLGFNISTPSVPVNSTPIPEPPADEHTEEPIENNSVFSDSDISDILAENGFSDTEETSEYYDNQWNEAMNAEEEDEEDDWDEEESERNTPNEALPEEDTFNPQEIDNTDYEVRVDPPTYTGQGIYAQMQTVQELPREEVSIEESSARPQEDDSLLPLNSPTLLIDESTTRFSGAEWYTEIQKASIIIAGIGGIGSWTVLQLARMTPANMAIYDDDIVEMVNMAGQLYSYNDIGKSKVAAMTEMISSYTTMHNIFAIKDKFTETTDTGDIMICGFDNMKARRTFYNSWVKHVTNKPEDERKNCLFIDGRLSMDTLQVLCMKGDDNYNIKRYRDEFLFTDYQAEATVCSMKQTTYLACMIGSLIVNLFTNFIANKLDPIIPYDLPFFTQYESQNMLFKTEN